MEPIYMATDYPTPVSLGRLLNFASGATNRMCQKMLAPHGLMLAQWVVLSALWREDGLPVSELARYSGNNLSAASRIVDRMVENGLVRRGADPADRRAVRVFLTEAGRALDHLADFPARVNAVLTAGLDPADQHRLATLLEHVLDNAARGPAQPDNPS